MVLSFDIIPIGISIIALLVSVAAILYSLKQSSSDYRVAQSVKSDIIGVLSALHSIIIKQELTLGARQDHNIETEKTIIENFLVSPTCLSLYLLIGTNSQMDDGDLRILPILLTEISSHSGSDILGIKAAQAWNILTQLNKGDIAILIDQYSDLSHSISGIKKSANKNPLVLAGTTAAIDDREFHKRFPSFCYFLKEEKKINDPDVDLLIATDNNDTEMLKKALIEGANPTITDTQLLRRYREYYEGFKRNH